MLAGHDADEFAIAPGGNGVAPGDALAVAEDGHAVDGLDHGAVVAQQNMTHDFLVEGGQVELRSGLSRPARSRLKHDGYLRFRGEGKRGTIQIPDMRW